VCVSRIQFGQLYLATFAEKSDATSIGFLMASGQRSINRLRRRPALNVSYYGSMLTGSATENYRIQMKTNDVSEWTSQTHVVTDMSTEVVLVQLLWLKLQF
jgi:hypothetical protein